MTIFFIFQFFRGMFLTRFLLQKVHMHTHSSVHETCALDDYWRGSQADATWIFTVNGCYIVTSYHD